MTRKWESSMAWVALVAFAVANGMAGAHSCLHLCSCHHDDMAHVSVDEPETANSCHEEDGHADHSSCPCEKPHPNEPSCPCPNDCTLCNFAQMASAVLVVPTVESSVCVHASPCVGVRVHIGPYRGTLIRPPRA